MAFTTNSNNDDQELSEINIIPLVDVMLVLLIIFMVAAPLMNDSVQVNLPKAQAKSAAVEEKSVQLTINKDTKIFIGKTEVSLDELAAKLSQIFGNRENKEIFLRADEKVNHGFVIKVMARIQRSGVYKIAFLTDPSEQ